MTKIVRIAENWDIAFDECVKAVRAGKLIVYPTDTVYGIGGSALDKNAVEKVYAAKGRDPSIPVSVIVANLEMLLKHFELNEDEIKLIMQRLPGPFTFILKAKAAMPAQAADGTVGVRIPNYVFMRQVCHEANVPIVTTSANLHGQPSPFRFQDVPKEIIGAAEIAVDGGETMLKGPSTVVNPMKRKVERQGVAEFLFDE